MEFPDLCDYPDSNKVGAYGSAAVGPNVGFRALYVRDRNVITTKAKTEEKSSASVKAARRRIAAITALILFRILPAQL